MNTDERLERLERQLTRTRGLFATVVVAGLAVLCVAQVNSVPRVSDEIVAKAFHLVDEKGRTRAKLVMSQYSKPTLRMLDENGKERVLMGTSEDSSSGLILLDHKGEMRMRLRSRAKSTPQFECITAQRL